MQDADCPRGPCAVCGPTRYACPEARCDGGVCEEQAASCEGAPCEPVAAKGAGDCGFALGWGWDGGGCKLLFGCGCEGPGCARLTATEASCAQGREGCVNPALPCQGKPCGAPCAPCPSGLSCGESPYRCDAQGVCAAGEPTCVSCLSDEDCVDPAPLACPNSAILQLESTCEAGKCKVPVGECPPVSICDNTDYSESAVIGCQEIFWGFVWINGACRELTACSIGIDPELLYPQWSSCYNPRKDCAGAPCQEASDCPAVTVCSTCPSGESACPAATCEAGSCRYQEGVCP